MTKLNEQPDRAATTWAVLFDCDGVLIDSEPVLAQIAADCINELGYPARPEDFAPYIGTGEDVYLGNVIRQYGGEYDPAFKEQVYAAYNSKAPQIAHEVPGAAELIRKLRQRGLRVAVASSADLVKVKTNLSVLDLPEGMIEAVTSGSDVERKKPWPDIYLITAEKLGVAPEHCFVIEDATAGVEAGVAGGMTTYAITTSVTRDKLAASGAHAVVDQLAEIMPLIEAKMQQED